MSDQNGSTDNPPAATSGGGDNMWDPLLSAEDRNVAAGGASGGGENLNNDDNKDIVFPKWVTFWRSSSLPPARLNHNVFLTIVLDAMYGISDSLWGGTVFAAYLKRLGHESNGPVGDIEAVNGLAILISAIPVGYLADKMGRSKVICAGGWLFVFTAIFHFGVLWWIGVDEEKLQGRDSTIAFVLLGVVMALWGIGGGIVSGPAQALYADSTPVGDRSKYYNYLFAAYLLSSCFGPLLSIVLFQTLGDDWDLYHLRTIVFVGLGLEVLNALIMMFFDDKKALDEEEETAPIASNSSSESTQQTPDDKQDNHKEKANEEDEEAGDAAPSSSSPEDAPLLQNGTTTEGEDSAVPATQQQQQQQEAEVDEDLRERRKWIPYILFSSSLVLSLGSGMTVKFFPLFFKDDVGLSPTHVQVIYFLVPIIMVIVSNIITHFAKGFGRVQCIVLVETLGVSCLYSMVYFKSFLDQHPFVLVPVYVIRTALMNGSYPIQESVLMDFVPKNTRARWKSLESIAVFGWCGSAALGGYLADTKDYTFTFLVTAVLQSIGVGINCLLLPLVPREEGAASATS